MQKLLGTNQMLFQLHENISWCVASFGNVGVLLKSRISVTNIDHKLTATVAISQKLLKKNKTGVEIFLISLFFKLYPRRNNSSTNKITVTYY